MKAKQEVQVIGVSNSKTLLSVAVALSSENNLTPVEQDFIETREALSRAYVELIASLPPLDFGYSNTTYRNRTSTKENAKCQLLATRNQQPQQIVQRTAQQQVTLALDQ